LSKHTTSREGIEMVNPDGILKTLRTNKELKERLSVPQLDCNWKGTLRDWANASGGTRSKLACYVDRYDHRWWTSGCISGLGVPLRLPPKP
jgi:hypothetical protein